MYRRTSGRNHRHPIWAPKRAFCATTTLFSESNGRLLLEVQPANVDALERRFASLPLTRLGVVSESPILVINGGSERLIELQLDEMVLAWKSDPAS